MFNVQDCPINSWKILGHWLQIKMATFAAIMGFMLENQTNTSDYRKMNESINE